MKDLDLKNPPNGKNGLTKNSKFLATTTFF